MAEHKRPSADPIENRLEFETLISELLVDDVVLGGGNAKKPQTLPPGCPLGYNANALLGRFCLWEEKGSRT